MLGLFGYIKQDLKQQNKLPVKFYDEIPSSPVTSGCLLYADALNNNGGSHSNSASKWKPIIGSTQGTKVGSPIWHDDCLECTANGFYFQKFSSSQSALTLECTIRLLEAKAGYFVANVHNGGAGLYNSSHDPSKLSASVWNDSTSAYVGLYKENVKPLDIVGKIVYLCLRVDSKSCTFYDSFTNSVYVSDKVSFGGMEKAPFAIGYNPNAAGAAELADTYNCKKYIYSARVYNRAISGEEMRQNMLYERNRYNF